MNKCEKCGFLHYRTDPCRVAKKPQEAYVSGGDMPKLPDGAKAITSPSVVRASTAPKPKRSGNRHRPGYFTEYMRQYRARKKASAEGRDE